MNTNNIQVQTEVQTPKILAKILEEEDIDTVISIEVKCPGCGQKYRVYAFVKTAVTPDGDVVRRVYIYNPHKDKTYLVIVKDAPEEDSATTAYRVLQELYPQ